MPTIPNTKNTKYLTSGSNHSFWV